MRIIRRGDPMRAAVRKQRLVKFECICGCVWIADKNEYKCEIDNYQDDVYVCACPTCNETTYAYKILSEEEYRILSIDGERLYDSLQAVK